MDGRENRNSERQCGRSAAAAGGEFIAWLAVAAREQVFRASLEGVGTRHKEPEGIGQSTDHVERETNRERILDLLTGSAAGLLAYHPHPPCARASACRA